MIPIFFFLYLISFLFHRPKRLLISEAIAEIKDPIGIKPPFYFFLPSCKIPFPIVGFPPNCKIQSLILVFPAILLNL